MEKEFKPFYTAKQTCEILNISRPTLHDWCNRGILKKFTVPGRRRIFIKGESIKDLLNTNN